MRVDLFSERDLRGFELQDAQLMQFEDEAAWHAAACALAGKGDAFTIRASSGRAVAVCGLVPVYPHYAMGWAFLAGGLGAVMVPLTRIVRRYLDAAQARYPRIEMNVHFEHKQGAWWSGHLGFKYEGTKQMAAPDGGDLITYVRIAGDAK